MECLPNKIIWGKTSYIVDVLYEKTHIARYEDKNIVLWERDKNYQQLKAYFFLKIIEYITY